MLKRRRNPNQNQTDDTRCKPYVPHLVHSTQPKENYKVGNINEEHKLHLAMDKESYARLGWLKAKLDAGSDTEVIRRALKAYELFEPDDKLEKIIHPERLDDFLSNKEIQHLYIRLSGRMMERLNDELKTQATPYGEQVRQALRVLTQLVRLREKLFTDLQTDKTSCDDQNSGKERMKQNVTLYGMVSAIS